MYMLFNDASLQKEKAPLAPVQKLNVLPHDFTLHLLEQGDSLRNILTVPRPINFKHIVHRYELTRGRLEELC